MINSLLKEKNMSRYQLSKLTGIPYTTVSDLVSGKADIRKCSVDTIYRISKVLGVTVDSIISPYYEKRPDFDLFKSNVCHELKRDGDIKYIMETLKSKRIITYYQRKWYPESLYLLSLIDYLSKQHDLPLCREYDELRKQALAKPVYPASVIAECAASKNDDAKEKAKEKAIPEFLEHNIIESDIRNVI